MNDTSWDFLMILGCAALTLPCGREHVHRCLSRDVVSLPPTKRATGSSSSCVSRIHESTHPSLPFTCTERRPTSPWLDSPRPRHPMWPCYQRDDFSPRLTPAVSGTGGRFSLGYPPGRWKEASGTQEDLRYLDASCGLGGSYSKKKGRRDR